MKKATTLLLTLMMCMTLAGCSEKEEKKAAASLTFKDKEVEVMQGDEVDVKDFVKNVEGKVKYPKLDTSEAGEQVLKYVVTGEDGKKKTYELTVNVKAKEETANTQTPEEAPAEEQTQTPTTQTPAVTPPVANTGGSNGSTATGSTGGNTTTSPTPPAQNVCVPNGTFGRLGNSGKYFIGNGNTMEEKHEDAYNQANEWALTQVFDENNQWYDKSWTMWTIYDNCGERHDVWTVNFY
ncbi:hypothetical protein NE663_06365 [Massilicoli timonensis]|uniref:Lipoprotein n=1 Tax=Massilicoli timonensis TaxID=2015901 RepID=A0ABT1SLJ2_9FIRM|nr:hypothetical protein [Massilicoli timonensis]MCQ5121883.1 hypothetical protein [Massilicoli timonensis]